DITNAYAAVGCERTETKDGAPPIVCTRIDLHNPRYFNSGFMILNLNKMRHDNIPEKLIDYKLHGKMWNMDQDALNAVIGYNVVYFDYNTHLLYHQLASEELREKYGKGTDRNLIQKCTVLHFTSHRKPWKTRLPIVTRMWLKYYKCTPYSDEKIKFARLFDRLYEKYYYRDGQGLLYRILNCKR
ncbi:MAG: glycosyltransferase, partial [Clostridia bacterium]|nr:glycosyltransferase [Clostridia bacterium]